MSFIKNHKVLNFLEENKNEILSWYDNLDINTHNFLDIRLDYRDLKSLNHNIPTNTLTKNSAPNFWLTYGIYPFKYCLKKNKEYLEKCFKKITLKTIEDDMGNELNWLKNMFSTVNNINQIAIFRLYNNKDVMILHNHLDFLESKFENNYFHFCLKNTVDYKDNYCVLPDSNEKKYYKRGEFFGFDPREMHGVSNVSPVDNDYRDVLLIAEIDDIKNFEEHWRLFFNYLYVKK